MGDVPKRLAPSSSRSRSRSVQPIPTGGELWMIAEERAQEILSAIQPIYVSDRSRNEVINYIQNLIRTRLGFEVFYFGSVPLKTYLPDGDLDMTMLTPRDKEEEYAKQVCSILLAKAGDPNFPIESVEYVPAQVKVIKFTIRNISVDISFNQMAGLCALCFLEQVDQMFGRDHLFKRSIILIKAWCYYESHILGANTGLFSTYALAILVLYIMNISYSSVSDPLSVLCKFLNYFVSFDWKKYCITVNGPVLISSLPDITENGNPEVFLKENFFKECLELYTIPTKATEPKRNFQVKHINILDPLKHSNNLGRSVTEGNLARIKHAFLLGVKSMRDALTAPGEAMGWKLEKFFRNTLSMNGKGQRQDVEEPVVAFGTGRAEFSQLRGDFDGYVHTLEYSKWFHGETTQQNWIPQGQDPSWYATSQNNNNNFYWNNLNGSTSMQNMGKSRGTGTYIPAMTLQSYTERFSNNPSTVNSVAEQSYSERFSNKPSTVNSVAEQSYTERYRNKPSTVNSVAEQSYSERFSIKPNTVNSVASTSQTHLTKQNP